MQHLTSNEILSKQREFFIGAIAVTIFFAIFRLIAVYFFAPSPADYFVAYQNKIATIVICYEGFKLCRKGVFKSYIQYVFIVGIIFAIVSRFLWDVPAFQAVYSEMSAGEKIAYFACLGFCQWLVVILSLISSAMSKKAKWVLCLGYLGFTSILSYLKPIASQGTGYLIALNGIYFAVYIAVGIWIYFSYTKRIDQQ